MSMAENSSPSNFKYQPLESYHEPANFSDSPRSFRLLELQPKTLSSQIHCELINTFIGIENGKYEALSYVWGDSNLEKRIIVNNEPFPVGENLYSALLALQNKCVRRLWIDAICINQRDILERNNQVNRMADIYKNAAQTLVYLGEEQSITVQDAEWIHQLAQSGIHEVQNMIWDETKGSSWDAFSRILNRPYWKRVWIAQEIAVSKTIVMRIGDVSIDFDAFQQVINILVPFYSRSIHKGVHHHLPPLQLDTVWAVLRAREQYLNPENVSPTLAELVIMFLSSLSTDPKDKAYAFVSMCRDPLTPNYALPLETIFKTLVELSIRESQSLDILSALNYAARIRALLPSWVPDFTANSPGALPSFTRAWRCAGDTKASSDNVHFCDSLMKAKGIFIDKIIAVCSTERIQQDTRWQDFIGHIQPHQTPYHSDAKWRIALYDTLLLDAPWQIVAKAQEQESTGVGSIYATWYIRRPLEALLDPWTYSFQGGVRQVRSIAKGRLFFLSQKGYIGLVPESARAGDELVVLYGSRVPFCIRNVGTVHSEHKLSGEPHEIIGDCYVHGIMEGEAMEELREGIISEDTFTFV